MQLVAFVALMLAVQASPPAEIDAISAFAQQGWQAARAAAPQGGSADSLTPAVKALSALDELAMSVWHLQATYARSLVAAAMAAAQDERGEMEVHLLHARTVSERLSTSRYPAVWPMPIDEAAGELWLEVDDYAQALKAFQGAVARRPSPASWLGLARSAARLDERERACDAYRQVAQRHTGDRERQEARTYLERCP